MTEGMNPGWKANRGKRQMFHFFTTTGESLCSHVKLGLDVINWNEELAQDPDQWSGCCGVCRMVRRQLVGMTIPEEPCLP